MIDFQGIPNLYTKKYVTTLEEGLKSQCQVLKNLLPERQLEGVPDSIRAPRC